jgi:hypothetical protein
MVVVGCLGGRVVMSSRGTAGCGFIGRAGVGIGYDWRTRATTFIGGACDLSAFAETRGRAAGTATQRSLTLPAGLEVAAFRIRGAGAPPSVTVTGPKGERVVRPSFMTRAGNDTYVVLAKPTGGAWKIVADPGSPAITSASSAQALPSPSVKASVGGKGRRRVLAYQVGLIPGQTVSFAERAGKVAREIGTARGARGTLRFSPGAGPAGSRTIVATVSQYGLPRRQLTVARYSAPAALRPGRPPKVTLSRKGTTLRIAWGPASGAPRYYRVLVQSVNRRKRLFEVAAGRRAVTLANVAAGDTATVTITGLTKNRLPGAAAKAVSRKRAGA